MPIYCCQKIRNLIKDTRVKTSDILRLVCLYALRYEKSTTSELTSLKELLVKRGGLTDQEKEVSLVNQFAMVFFCYDNLYFNCKFMNKIVLYGGSRFRETDLFLNQNPMAITKRLLKGLKVYLKSIDFNN